MSKEIAQLSGHTIVCGHRHARGLLILADDSDGFLVIHDDVTNVVVVLGYADDIPELVTRWSPGTGRHCSLDEESRCRLQFADGGSISSPPRHETHLGRWVWERWPRR